MFVLGFTFSEGFDPTKCSCLVQTKTCHFPPHPFSDLASKSCKISVGWRIQIRKFMTTSICIKILTIFILPQSCQRTDFENYPAGTANTTFSVDREDNVVITYGASKGPDNFWRYFATLSSNQSLRSGERVKE